MSRIAYVNGRYLPHRAGRGPYRGPRLSVRRRRLRGLRGAGRAPDRPAPAHGAAGALARRAAHPLPMPLNGAAVVYGVKPSRAIACATASSICRSPAASRGATTRFRRPAPGRPSWSPRRRSILQRPRSDRGEGIAVITRAGQPLAARRHQVGVAAAERARQAGGARAGRAEAWFVDGTAPSPKALVQCLDRHPRRQGGHPAGRPRHPARHHAHRGARGLPAQGLELEERPFTMEEAYAAREAFVTSASQTRHAGGADRRAAGRQRRARAGRSGAAAGFPPLCRDLVKHLAGSSSGRIVRDLVLALGLACHLMKAPPSRSWVWGLGAMQRRIKLPPGRRSGHLRANNGITAMAAERAQNLQDTFLNHVRKAKLRSRSSW